MAAGADSIDDLQVIRSGGLKGYEFRWRAIGESAYWP